MGEKYVIGMDGGGTATQVVAADLRGNVLAGFRAGSLNINGQPEKMTRRTLFDCVEEIRKRNLLPGDCMGICIGAAGVSNENTQRIMKDALYDCGINAALLVVGDHETALAGAVQDMWGMILIAGTGSICYGVSETGENFRAGGYGHLIDDEGSAYAIGRDMLKAVVRAEDGRCGATVLKELIYRKLKIENLKELTAWLYAEGRSKKDIAALAVLLEEKVTAQDAACINIMSDAVKELVLLAEAVCRNSTAFRAGTLAVGGSVLIKNNNIYEDFCRRMKEKYPGMEVSRAGGNAAEGALRIILKETGHGKIPCN